MAKIPVILSTATAIGTAIGLTGTIATVVGGIVLAAGAVIVAKAVKKIFTPEIPSFDEMGMGAGTDFAQSGSQGILINKSGSSSNIPVIYGLTRTGGMRTFIETSGTDNTYLNMVFVLGEGEMNACKKIFFDGVEVMTTTTTGANNNNWTFTESKYDGLVTAQFFTGTDTQTAPASLSGAASWTGSPDHKGLAYVYLKLEYDSEVWKNGLPVITFEVEGKLVPDTSTGTTRSYSDNPARCILDYLISDRYGKGIDVADIDLQSFADAETYYNTKGFHVRGNLDTKARLYTNMLDLFTSCRSYLAFGNKYRLIPEKAESTVQLTLDDSNTIGDVTYVLADKKTMFNKLKARFMNETTEYRDDIAVVESTTLQQNDNDHVLEAEIPLPYTKTTAVAQQLMTEEINESRQSHMIELTATVAAIDLQVGDLVQVTNSTFGITNKKFRVTQTTIEPTSEVRLTLKEYSDDVYGTSIITNYKDDNNG